MALSDDCNLNYPRAVNTRTNFTNCLLTFDTFAQHTALATLVHNLVIKLAAPNVLPLTARTRRLALVCVLLHFNFDLQTYGTVV